MEDKRNESERERTSRRETEILGELRANKGGETGTWRVCLGQLQHNARKRIERSNGEEGRKGESNVNEIRRVILD